MILFLKDSTWTLNGSYLDQLIPTSGDNHRVLWVWRKSNARDPISVSLFLDGVLAVTKGVPELDCPVAGP